MLLPLLALAQAAETFGDLSYYLGDPHVHTGVSADGGSADLGDCTGGTCGNAWEVFSDAQANGLDWIAISDHSNGNPKPASDADQFSDMLALALASNVDGSFITLPSAEVWFTLPTGRRLGHKNVLMFGEDSALSSMTMSDFDPTGDTDLEVASCSDIEDWMDDLVAAYGPALAVPHHPAAAQPMPTDWSCHSDTYEPSVEIYSGHGNSLEETSGYDPIWSGFTESGSVTTAIDPGGYGLSMGFMAGSDSHDTRPGNVCVTDSMHTTHPYGGGYTIAVLNACETLTRESLYNAIVEHRTLASTGLFVPVQIDWESGGASLGGLGDTLSLPAGQDLNVTVSVPDSWEAYVVDASLVTPEGEVALAVDCFGVWTGTLAAADVNTWAYVRVELDGDAYYGGTCADGGADGTEFIWASPSWIEEGPDDLDGDGEAYLDGDCDDGDATVYSSAKETWYDGLDQNCDGNDDDQDGDGFAHEVDCDDTSARAYPGAGEIPGDGVDQDCDGRDAPKARVTGGAAKLRSGTRIR